VSAVRFLIASFPLAMATVRHEIAANPSSSPCTLPTLRRQMVATTAERWRNSPQMLSTTIMANRFKISLKKVSFFVIFSLFHFQSVKG
jgi:hypothetical protein